MGSVGTAPVLEDYFNGALGDRRRVDPLTVMTNLNETGIINPNYGEERAYDINCALCTVATTLQAMGYDVEAMPRDKSTWRGPRDVFDIDYSNPDNYIAASGKSKWLGQPRARTTILGETIVEVDGKTVARSGFDVMPRGAKKASQAIIDKVKGWGSGAFGELSVKWAETSGGHSVIIGNQNGTVFIYDSQSNKVETDIQKYIQNTTANTCSITRLDNAKVKSNIKNLDKMVRRRNKK